MRTIVVTGAAGCGVSAVAGALAHRMLRNGRRTVLVRSAEFAPTTAPEADGPEVRIVDPLAWGESVWQAAGTLRRMVGPPWSRVAPSDVLPFPGLPELAWWGVLRGVWREQWDTVVVDAGPLDAAMRMLVLPDTVVGGLRRTWPLQERTAAAAGELAAGSWHLRAMARLDSEAAEFADRMRSGSTSIHLVARPAHHDLMRVLAALAPMALFELPVTDIVLNGAGRRPAYDAAALHKLTGSLPGTTVRVAREHPSGPSSSELADEVYSDIGGGRRIPRPRLGRTGEHYVWKWHLPFVDPTQASAVIDREDIILTVGRSRRVVPLPSVLRRCRLVAVTASSGVVRLTFVPDPDVWPAPKE